jgi:acetate kinase
MASNSVLTVNAGSSSIKFALYQVGEALKQRLYKKVYWYDARWSECAARSQLTMEIAG